MRLPFRYLIDNGVNGMRLIEACVQHGISRFVLSSTAALYGTPMWCRSRRTRRSIRNHPTATASGFSNARCFGRSACMDCVMHRLRYFNAAGADPAGRYGEDHRPETHLVPLVIDAALGRRGQLDVYGDDYATPDGTCLRDYVHVTDLADAHLLALDWLETRQHHRQSRQRHWPFGAAGDRRRSNACRTIRCRIASVRVVRVTRPCWWPRPSARSANSVGGHASPTWMRSCAPRCGGARRTRMAMLD